MIGALAALRCGRCGRTWQVPEQDRACYGGLCCGFAPEIYDSAYFEALRIMDEDDAPR